MHVTLSGSQADSIDAMVVRNRKGAEHSETFNGSTNTSKKEHMDELDGVSESSTCIACSLSFLR